MREAKAGNGARTLLIRLVDLKGLDLIMLLGIQDQKLK